MHKLVMEHPSGCRCRLVTQTWTASTLVAQGKEHLVLRTEVLSGSAAASSPSAAAAAACVASRSAG